MSASLMADDAVACHDLVFAAYPTEALKVAAAASVPGFKATGTPSALRATPLALVYGEVDVRSFTEVLAMCRPAPGDVFFDLGSGAGRAVLAAALLYGDCFSACCGVELLPVLHGVALNAELRYRELLAAQPLQWPFLARAVRVELHCGDLVDAVDKWAAADVVFCNSTCFDDRLLRRLAAVASQLKPGARLVTLTHALPGALAAPGLASAPCEDGGEPPCPPPSFQLEEQREVAMSWGAATVFLHRRLAGASATA